jgi:hypothetical protein
MFSAMNVLAAKVGVGNCKTVATSLQVFGMKGFRKILWRKRCKMDTGCSCFCTVFIIDWVAL